MISKMCLKLRLILLISFVAFAGCRSNSDDELNSDHEEETKDEGINFYPIPPEKWTGKESPVYAEGYIGDVMPYYDNGIFNIFFLHDAKSKPEGKGFHDIHKFESEDFIKYSYKGQMIPYGGKSSPDFALGTGSILKDNDTYYYFYTGHNGEDDFLKDNPRESVLLATSDNLDDWQKEERFKIIAPSGYYDYEFRDPHVFYNEDDQKFWMLVSTQNHEDRKAVILKFTSDDVSSNSWEMEGPIYTSDPPEDFLMLETPDIIKINNYWYLLFSENWSDKKGTRYRISESPNGPWKKPNYDRLDGSYFYAGKSVSEGENYYLAGWLARNTPEKNSGDKDWAGNLVVHQLVQASDGSLDVKIPNTIKSLFTENMDLDLKEDVGSIEQDENTFELNSYSCITFNAVNRPSLISFDLDINDSHESGVILGGDTSEGIKLTLEPENNRIAAYNIEDELINQLELGLNTTYEIKMVINEDIAVIYIDGKFAFSNRIYGAENKEWSMYSKSGKTIFSNIQVQSIN